LTKVQSGAGIAAFQQTSIFKALHGDRAAFSNALEYVYSPEDQMMIISSFAQLSDTQMHTFSSKQNVAAFRKSLTAWTFPTWATIKAEVGQWWADKKEEVANTWETMKTVLSDLGNARWCKLCDAATNHIATQATNALELAWTDPTEAVCGIVDWLFEEGCGAILTPLLTAAITVTVPVIGALGGKVADAICWVLGKANGYACRKVPEYGAAIVTKVKAKIPAAAGQAAADFVAAVKAEIATWVGKGGAICKTYLKVCPGTNPGDLTF
jgi:hypothetical protein